MPTELKFNERTGNGDATQVVTYTTKDANHLLVWSFDEFRPSYNGGLIYVTAKLIGMDGNVQSYKIPFLVKRMLANNMTSAKTTKNSSGKTVLTTTSVYNSAVETALQNSIQHRSQRSHKTDYAVCLHRDVHCFDTGV